MRLARRGEHAEHTLEDGRGLPGIVSLDHESAARISELRTEKSRGKRIP